MDFLQNPTRNLLFTGKGGVGKTSLACAAAVQLADRGCKVLLVSTDPASNLDDVLEASLGAEATPIPKAPHLAAMNISPEAAAAAYRQRMVEPYRGVLPDAAIRSIEEQFSGACTVEIAAFDEFARLLGNPDATAQYDHVVFDTAPTGHTLRLLTLPAAWTDFLESSTTGASCLGPLAGLQAQQQIYSKTVESLAEPTSTTLILVARPESSALSEAARTSRELQQLGVSNQHLVVNGVFRAIDDNDATARAMESRSRAALDAMPEDLTRLPVTQTPMQAEPLLGVDSLRRFGNDSPTEVDRETSTSDEVYLAHGLDDLIAELAAPGHGVVLTMGKGGVGKTTIASAVAVALAERGYDVLLSTTDPAAHLATTLAADSLPNLAVARIDPAEEVASYRAEVLQNAGRQLDAQGKALLEEDLRSPCTEEIAVFRAFARAVAQGSDRFVVLDTAPTGHTILLLDAALAYHRELSRQSSEVTESVEQLLPRLRDPVFTRVLVVTLPETTPVHEATALQVDLRRAEIEPYGWIINQSLQPLSVRDPILARRRGLELPLIRQVETNLAERTALVPWQATPPRELDGLRALLNSTNHLAGRSDV